MVTTSGRSDGGPDWVAVFEHLPTAYLVMDDDLVIVDANRAYLDLLHRDRDELVGRHVLEAFPPPPEELDDDGRHPLQKSFERARDTGRPDRMPLFDYPVTDPATGLAETRCWSLISSAVPGPDGRSALVLQRVEDVSDYLGARPPRDDVDADLLARAHELRAALAAHATASKRLAGLTAAALQLASVESEQELADVVLATALGALGSDGGVIGVLDPDAGELRVEVTSSLGDGTRERYARIPLDSPLPMAWAARTGRRVLLPDRAACVAFTPEMAAVVDATGREGWAVLPLRAGDRVLGALATAWSETHPLDGDEVDLLAAFAAQCAQALDRLRVRRAEQHATDVARELSAALQRSLLSEPPRPAGLDIAVRYLPASTGAQVGGDWYDAFVGDSSSTTLVVGDVTGHDGDAAASMAQVRNVLRGVAQSAPDSPSRVLQALDRTLHHLQVDTLATAVLAQVRPKADAESGTRVVQWSNAGHPPPLLVLPGGTARLLSDEPDLLLGLQPDWTRHDHHAVLPAGSTLVLYTDGLFERRGESLDEGLERLRRTAAAHASLSADALCEALVGDLEDPLPDDVALLALRVLPVAHPAHRRPCGATRVPRPSRTMVLPSDPVVVRQARELVEQMCHEAHVDEDTQHTAVLLTSETVTNAIVHGRSDATLTVTASPGVVRVEVGDEDSRRPHVGERDPHALGGRGLEIVQMLAQRWGVRDEARGKVVWFELEG